MSIENNKEREWPPLANVFYEDEHMVSPRQLRKYGYRLKKGIKYRLYSLTELKEMIEDGRVVRVVPRPSRLTPKDGKTPAKSPAHANPLLGPWAPGKSTEDEGCMVNVVSLKYS